MPPHHPLAPCWSTSSLGAPADMTEQERLALCQHLGLCVGLFGPLQAPVQLLGGALAWLHTRLAGRAVTSVTLVGAVALLGWMVL